MQTLEDIAHRYGLRLVLRFGSTVGGPTHARSDVDLAVLAGAPALGFDQWADLTHDLQALFPERRVDVALINRADPLFLKQITERSVLLYGSRRTLAELKLYAFKRYQDHRHYLRLERDYVSRRLRALGAP